jgi:micrococcal nuclease
VRRRQTKIRIALPIAAFGVVLFCVAAAPVAAGDGDAIPIANTMGGCTLEPGPTHTVARIVDGETLQLDDGAEVRLIGSLSPRASDVGARAGQWPSEAKAIQALTDAALGRTVKLAYSGRKRDRYGRHLAHVFVISDGIEQWLQGELLASGSARAYGLPGSFGCAAALMAHEQVARAARRGVWNISVYRPKPARLVGLLMRRRSHFEIVTGTVTDVSHTRSATYLNFGSDWKTDFTVRIGKDVLSSAPSLQHALGTLAGRHVSVRGWIERRNGPMIDIRDPAQIDFGTSTDLRDDAVSRDTAPSAAEPAHTPGGREPPATEPDPQKRMRPEGPVGTPPGAVNL